MANFSNAAGVPATSHTYTNPSASTYVTVIGILVGNTTTTDTTIEVKHGASNVIATDIPLPSGSLKELIQGKVVIEPSGTLTVSSDATAPSNIGVLFSVLEGV